MAPNLGNWFATFRSSRQWINPKAWALSVALLFAAQFGLLLHQAGHHLLPDLIATADDCAVCQVAAGLDGAPSLEIFVLPLFLLLAVISAPAAQALLPVGLRLNFRSRAPPLSING